MSWMTRIRSKAVAWALAPALAGAVAASTPAGACTSFVIPTTDGGVIYGRTMEMGFLLKSAAIVVPRNFAFTATGPDGKPGAMTWTSKYAAVGLNAFGMPVLVDGLNEKGLAGGALYFPDYVGYADPAKANPKHSLAQWDFLTWALTSFASVAEVKAALAGMSVIGVKTPDMGVTPPLHYTLHDASGAAVVIEPVDGVLKVHDNPFGVMTNSPTFDWHLSNLRNYVKISPTNAPPLQVGGQTVAPLGQGSGLLGIPGDPTPPSRFIRALGYAMSVQPKAGGMESVRLAEHILNNFDIPQGWVRPGQGDATAMEFTQWSVIADLASLRYYVKTYDDQVLRAIDLPSFDPLAKKIQSAPLTPALGAPELVFSKKP
ncbi:choloylglycine hydrolase family protein [Blastochloris tepida]|uniref:Choloylglycine hydrolase n=1 Tax=Blastochloris tepida TaxID=2233851 RepID=A0A348G277_9HYPH|nr:choloylglycine hydrolase [Blastochloris tepida]